MGALASVSFMAMIGDIGTMAWGAVASIPFVVAMLIPAFRYTNQTSDSWYFSNGFTYPIIILVSVINGLGQGAAESAQGKYIADCATESTKGFFFSYFWAFYMGSQVVGNLISAFALGDIGQVWYVVIMIIFTVLSAIATFFLRAPTIIPRNSVYRTVRLSESQFGRKSVR